MSLPDEELNSSTLYAAKQQLDNARDNLYRAQRANASWVSGNGETLRQVINSYQKNVNHWLEVIEYLRSK